MSLGLSLLIASSTLLALILLWTLYNLPILISGLRFKNSRTILHTTVGVETTPSFSIIVPAKDEEPFIRRCLDSLLAIDYPREKVEVIVVDGGSKDKTYHIIQELSEKHPGQVKVLRQLSGRGKPSALNLALHQASSEIIAVFDADSIPERDVLKKAASYFHHLKAVALQGRTGSINKTLNALTKISSLEEEAWFRILLQGRESTGLFIPFTGSCQFIRRSLLNEIGGWDEQSLTEDVELAVRLLEKGYLVKYAHDICSWQEAPCRLKSFTSQRLRWFRGYMETALKYGRLLRKPNWRRVDAEVVLSGPFVMTLCLASYFLWILHLFTPIPIGILGLNPGSIAAVLTSVTLSSIGLSLALSTKPFRLKNLIWIPFIYLYWLLQTVIATWSLIRIILRRPRIWSKTEKI